jgi:hypothetical protein
MQTTLFCILTVLVTAPPCIQAQWLNQPDPRTPRTHDGKPNLSAAAPRAHGLGEDDPQKYFLNILADYKPGEGPLNPAAAELGFNDRSGLDATGHFHSEAMHVTERFHRRDFGHMEAYCAEGEQDLAHLPGQLGLPPGLGLYCKTPGVSAGIYFASI